MKQRILTKHPEGKLGVNIEKEKYELIKHEILRSLEGGPLTFNELTEKLNLKLKSTFDGSVTWYTVTVKLDLEARGEIVRVKEVGAQRIKLK